MILTRTPLRISFAGGGTDLAAYYRAHGGGAVTSAAIDRYIHVLVNPKFDRSIRVAYSQTENVDRLDELQHGLFREALRTVGLSDSIEIHSVADIPGEGTGLGSSSTLSVGLLNALYAYRGLRKSPEELAEEACRLEIDRLGGTLGKQDQYIAALGGLQYLEFRPDDTVRSTPIPLGPEELDRLAAHLSLFYTGITRRAQGILKEQNDRTSANLEALSGLKELAVRSRDALLRHDYPGLGSLLHEGWERKRTLAPGVSTPAIDAAYERLRAAGAYGGKITGAGGGGFLVVIHPPERSREIAEAVPAFQHLRIRVAPEGTRVLTVTH